MSENQPPITDPKNSDPAQPAPKPKRKKRWLVLKILAVLVILVIGLIALLPTLASTGAVRSMIVGKVNEQLNGKVEIADWSFGWFSPISVSGVKVYDDQNRLVLDVARVKLGISIMGAIRSNFALGEDNLIEVASFNVRVDEKGGTNLEKLPRTGGTRKPPETPPTPPSGGKSPRNPIYVPNISGKFTVALAGGTIESPKSPAVHVDDSKIIVTITDINQPIQNQVSLKYRVGNDAVSSIEVNGTVEAIKQNLLDIEKVQAGQKLAMTNVNLSAAEAFLGEGVKLTGMASGGIEVKADGLTGLSATGQINIDGVSFAGGPLGADTFKTERISIPVNVTRSTVDGKPMVKFENVGVQVAGLASVKVTGQVPEQALRNLGDKKAPGEGNTGSISIVADVTDLKNLVGQLKNTLKLQQGVEITGGTVHEQIDITLTKDGVTVAQQLNASAEGTSAGKQIKLQPINVTAQATAIPNGQPIPEVKDIKLGVQSVFATLTGGGASLAKIDINGNFDLAKLRAEAGQFVDFKELQLAGTGTLAINTNGDVTNPDAPLDAQAILNFQNVKITGLASQGINQDQLAVTAKGQLTRKDNSPTGVTNGVVSIVSGNPASPLLGGEINADVSLANNKTTVPKWNVKFDISNLGSLQSQYGGLVPALAEQKIQIASGQIHVAGAGQFDGTTATITTPLTVALQSLTMTKEGRSLMRNQTLNLAVAGAATMGDQTSASISTLSLTTHNNIIGMNKVGDVPLTLTIDKAGAITGAGTISLMADLKTLAAIGKQFAPPASPDQPQLTSGTFNATLSVATAQDTKLKLDGQLSALTIETGGKKTIDNEQLTIVMNATAPADLKSATPMTAEGKIGSSFFTTNLSGVKIAINQTSPYDMLQSANLDVQVPDIPKLYALLVAAGGSPKPAPGEQPAPPLQITSGNAAIKLTVLRDSASTKTTIDLSEANINALAMNRGTRAFKFDKPISFKLKTSIKAASPIQTIEVTQLSGNLGVATLEMPKPISIDLSKDQPSYGGVVKVVGSIDALTPLLAVIQNADPLPYSGDYQLTQQITTSGSTTTLDGSIDINKFKVMDATRKNVVFTEDQIAIRNLIDLDLTRNDASVKTLTVDMPKSQAVGVKFNGKVSDWVKARAISGVSTDKAKLDLTYDLEKIWPIVKPMLSPDMQKQYADLKVKGKYTKTFNVWGSFPELPNTNDSLAKLNADGGLALDLLDLPQGLHIEKFELPIAMTSGVLATKAAAEPRTLSGSGARPLTASTALCNDGALNLDGMTLDLTKASPLLTMPAKHVLLRNVKLNTVLASALGNIGFIIFSDVKTAEGLLTMSAIQCDKLPITELMAKKQQGTAVFAIAINDLHLDSFLITLIAQQARLGRDGLHGNMTSSSVTLAKGQAQTDITIQVLKVEDDGRLGTKAYPMKFYGGVDLTTLDLRDFKIELTNDMLKGDAAKYAPNGAIVPLKGKANKPEIDWGGLLKDNIANTIEGIFGGSKPNNNTQPNQGNTPQQQKPADPVGGALDQIFGGNRNRNQQQQQTPPPPPPPARRGRAPASAPSSPDR